MERSDGHVSLPELTLRSRAKPGSGECLPVRSLLRVKTRADESHLHLRNREPLQKTAKLESLEGSAKLLSEGTRVLLGTGLFRVSVTCEGDLGTWKDECVVNTDTPVENESAGVLLALKENDGTCSELREGELSLSGKIKVIATEKKKLSVS